MKTAQEKIRMEQAFRDSISDLPNYRRTLVWEYVNLLKSDIAGLSHEIERRNREQLARGRNQ